MANVKGETVQKWISDHPELIYDQASGTIYCTKCEAHLKVTNKSNIRKHIEGAVHQGRFKRPQEEYYFDLIKFFILCNIPWSQMKNPAFKEFFQKYMCSTCCCICTSRKVPDESQLRKVYLDKFFMNKINSIYEDNKNEKLWISLDETTDFLGRYIVHFIIKPLHPANNLSRPYLIACKMLTAVNGQTITQFVLQCLENLWQENMESKVSNILMLCTDSVAYMLSAGRNLKNFLPKMKHVTCLAHALHRVSEQIRSEYNDVDMFIANVKKVFLKAPSRVNILKEKYPNLPLPPQPVITRWGTWLEAVSYYAENFDKIKDVLSCLNSSDAVAIRNAKNLIGIHNLQNDLKYIEDNYSIIQQVIKELQKQNLSIADSLLLFDQVRITINQCNSENIKNKIENVMERNPDLDIIREFSERIEKKTADDLMSYYKFAPLTSSDVERSFSMYKWILDVKRNRLKIENIEKLMIIYFNCIGTENQNLEIDVDED